MTRVVALVRGGGAMRVAVSLGDTLALGMLPLDQRGALAAARAAGAFRAINVWDDSVAATDYLGAAQVLASSTRKLGFDVVVCGSGIRGAVGPAVAERLGLPHLTSVVDARIEEGKLIARRRAGGAIRSFRAVLPVVLCVESFERPAIVEGVAAVTGAAPAGDLIEQLSLADVGVSPAELSWRRRFAPRPATAPPARPRLLANVTELAERLAAEGLLSRRG